MSWAERGDTFYLNEIPLVPGKEPTVDAQGRILYVHAPEIPREWSSDFWQRKNLEMSGRIDRKKCQVVVLSPHSNDVTVPLLQSLRQNPVGYFPAITSNEQLFPDRELDIRIDGEGIGVESLYLVASILDERDYSRIRKVADHFKYTLGTKYVTLFATFLGNSRKDKNVTTRGEYEPSVTSIRAEINGLQSTVDRIIGVEPHSSAAAYFAAKAGIPFAPVSPWQLLAESLLTKMSERGIAINPNNLLVVRPDEGRNRVATKIGQRLGLQYVSLEKTRVSGREVVYHELPPEEQAKVVGKDCIVPDDEVASLGTISSLADALKAYGASSLSVCAVHCKFTPGWERRMHPLIKIILGTDSREPIGNINMAGNIEIVSLVPFIRNLISADIEGINFWNDSRFSQMIL